MKRILIFIPCFFLSLLSGAQQSSEKSIETWGLQQCIDFALKNNLQVKQNELNAKLSQISLTQTKANVLPTINGNASHNYNFGRTIDPFTNQFAQDKVLSQNFSLSGTWTIFNGLQNYFNIQRNNYSYMAANFDVEKSKNDIALNVATAYMQILYNQELVSISEKQLNISKNQVERTKLLFENGAVAKGNLLEIQTQLANEELNQINAQNQLDISYLTLYQLLNLEQGKKIVISNPQLNPPSEELASGTPGQIYLSAVTNQPQIKSAEMRAISAKKGVNSAWGGVSPRVTLSGAYGTGFSGNNKILKQIPAFTGFSPNGYVTSSGDTVLAPTFETPSYQTKAFSEQLNDNLNKSIGVFISIPIFNKLQNHSNIQTAKIQHEIAENNLLMAKLELERTIQQAYADAGAALKKYFATLRAVDASKESYKYSEQRFNAGMLNTVEYNTSKNNLLRAETDLLQAKYNYILKIKVLDFYQGKPLTF